MTRKQRERVTHEDIVRVCKLICESEIGGVHEEWLAFLMQHTAATMGKSTLHELLLHTGVAKAIRKKVDKSHKLIQVWKRHCSLKTTRSNPPPVLFSSGSQKKWIPLSNL
jgi:hypothetical protein